MQLFGCMILKFAHQHSAERIRLRRGGNFWAASTLATLQGVATGSDFYTDALHKTAVESLPNKVKHDRFVAAAHRSVNPSAIG